MNSSEKEKLLISQLQKMKKVVLAFSGGVDSTYLANIAADTLGENAIAITIETAYISSREIAEAKQLALDLGINHQILKVDALRNQNITDNPPNRCYFCKVEIFHSLIQYAQEHNIPTIIDGSNTDDQKEFRPGIKALKELNIRSPLYEAGLTKEEIRMLSKKRRLPTWDKTSNSCLATRIPYGYQLTNENLHQVDQAEAILSTYGFTFYRVRHHDQIARIEIPKEDFSILLEKYDAIVVAFKNIGFTYVTLDLEGFRSGSLNEVFKKAE